MNFASYFLAGFPNHYKLNGVNNNIYRTSLQPIGDPYTVWSNIEQAVRKCNFFMSIKLLEEFEFSSKSQSLAWQRAYQYLLKLQ
jgi:hypothetical protein